MRRATGAALGRPPGPPPIMPTLNGVIRLPLYAKSSRMVVNWLDMNRAPAPGDPSRPVYRLPSEVKKHFVCRR